MSTSDPGDRSDPEDRLDPDRRGLPERIPPRPSGSSRWRNTDAREGELHLVRGIALLLVLGPIFVVSALVAAAGLASAFVSGLDPRNWFSSQAADWLLGSGIAGDAGNYLRFMLGGFIAALSGAAIRWGFKG